MAHFARVVGGQVVKVHVLNNDVMTNKEGAEDPDLGKQFLADLHGYPPEEIVQCSYNGKIRYNYPLVGDTYDSVKDAFIAPKPFESWLLNEQNCQWYAPVPMPEDDNIYNWDEASTSWIAL